MSVQQVPTRAAATVTDVAAMCQLSRSRFYDLVRAGVFPAPVQNASVKRPLYVRDLIEKCLEIRRTGVGLDGKIVVFNRKRTQRTAQRRGLQTPVAVMTQESPCTSVIAGLKSLGMLDATERQVESIVAALFPGGVSGQDLGDVIRAVFLELKKQG
jgi:hypothetical protein